MIGLVQAGYENVVASMGTSLTERQLRELRQLARNVVLLFDADAAGSDAALRGLELASGPDIGLQVRVALPPRGSDPADVAAAGREAVDRMLAGARSVLAFRVALVLDAADLSTADGRTRPTRRCGPCCATRRRRPSATSSCGSRPSRLRLPSDAPPRLARAPAAAAPAAPEQAPARLRMDAGQRDERLLLALAWRAAIAGLAVLERVPAEAFSHEDLREAHAWVHAPSEPEDLPPVQDVQRLEAELVALAARHGGPEALDEVAGRVESAGSSEDWNPSRRSSLQPR